MRGVLLPSLSMFLWMSAALSGTLLANKIITGPLPETVEVCLGHDTTICVYATPLVAGDQLRYQWYKNGDLIPGEEGPCLTIRNPQLADDWSTYEVLVQSYYVSGSQVIVTGEERSATTLRVFPPPTIVSQPQNWSGCEGTTLSLSVVVSDAAGLSFQWYKDGVPVPGADAATYVTRASADRHAGTWWCVISGPCGTLTTDQVQVQVRKAPRITRRPAATAECVGRQVSLTVEAEGDQPLQYQWYRNGVPVGTGQTLTFTMDRTTEGNYTVTVSNSCGSITTDPISVVALLPPQITSQPQDVQASSGSRVVLRVEATGTLPFSYQWQKDGQDIPGATSQTYVIENVQKSDEGRYRCKVSNQCGEVWSNEAEVRLISVPENSAQSSSTRVSITPLPVTGTATVRFVAPGTSPVHLSLYDAYGRQLLTVAEGTFVGEHRLQLNVEALGLAAGVYVLRLEAPGSVLSQPFVVVR